MKVFGWQTVIGEVERVRLGDKPGTVQARAIVAAKSKAAVARIAGVDRPSQLFNLCETGNTFEIGMASLFPGVIFIASMDRFSRRYIALKPEDQ